MEIVKKNIVSIICGVVALAAVVVAFTFVSGKMNELQRSADARKAAHDSLRTLLTKPRELPVVDPDNPTAAKLDKFPSESIIKQGEAITAAVATESKTMSDAAVAMNAHKPLVPGALPLTTMVSGFQFRNLYQTFFPQAAGAGPGAPAAPPPGGNGQPVATNEPYLHTQFAKDLHAGMPPTPDEIRVALENKVKDINARMLIMQGQNAINAPAVAAAIRDAQLKLPDQLKMNAAQGSKVYINADTFDAWPKIAGGAQPQPEDVFIAQLMLWIQQDVVAAVNDINGPAKSILDAPVKHLIKVWISPAPVLPAAGASTAGDADAAINKVPGVSVTARACNPMYDVYHFTVVADVETDKVDDWLRALGKNRLITPLNVEMHSLDAAQVQARNYMYGDKPFTTVIVNCEELFLRKWTEPLMPPLIKTQLGITPAGGATPQASAGG